MAIKCVHAAMTKDAMKEFGFREAAYDVAADKNELVDKKQGKIAEEANLHAMRGIAAEKPLMSFSSTAGLQSEADAREAVAKIINDGRNDIVRAVLQGDYAEALKRMGETLHTVQDRAFHNFEPWLYNALFDSIIKAPNYMICHGIRDLSVVSDIVIGPMGQRREIELSRRVADDVYVGVRIFDNARAINPYLSPTTHGPQWNDSFLGTGALFSLTFGAAPGSLPRPGSPLSEAGPSGEGALWQTTMRGVAMRTRAEDDSKEFIRSIEKALGSLPQGAESWAAFVSWNGLSRPVRMSPPIEQNHF